MDHALKGVDVLDEAEDLWGRTLAAVRNRLESPGARVWVEEARARSFADDRIVVAAPSPFAKDRIVGRFGPMLTNALRDVTGRDITLEVTVEAPDGPVTVAPAPAHPQQAAEPEPSAAQSQPLAAKYTFDSFVRGPSNRFAAAPAQAVAEQPAKSFNPLFIYGGPGLGKTHLLHAIQHEVGRLYPQRQVRYVTSEQFMNEFIGGVQEGKMAAFRRRYREADVLLVDDIQFLARGEQTQEEFFHTFNALHNDGRQIVISSDRAPGEIPTLEERLRTRFEWGLITDVQPPDLETRTAILQKKAIEESFDVPADVLTYIAENVQDNIRELEGRLIRVVSYSSLAATPLTLELAKELLQPLICDPAAEISADLIIDECSTFFAVPRDDLLGQSRSRPLVHARQVAMYLSRELTSMSLPKIGSAFGGRDHTTVMHAVSKIRAQMGERRQVYTQLHELTARIRSRASAGV